MLTAEQSFYRRKLKIQSCKLHSKQIFHAFLFNIRNYSPEVINIQRREGKLNVILPRVNNFGIKEKRHGIFLKQDL